jgi:HSP20 family protein
VTPDETKRLHAELEDVFNELWHGPRFGVHRRAFAPRIDAVRTEEPDELRVVVELPGIDAGDVSIVVHERALVVSGRRRPLQPEGPHSYHLLEIPYGPFERRIGLPVDVDPGTARATYDRGLLVVTLPVAASPPPQGRIAIRVRTRAR